MPEGHPVFPRPNGQRYEEGNVRFLQRPPLRMRHKSMFDSGTELRQLYLALALLESMHMLSGFTADQAKFAAFCQSEGIYGSGDDSEDVVVDSLMRAVKRFKSQYHPWHGHSVQRSSSLSRTRISRILVPDTSFSCVQYPGRPLPTTTSGSRLPTQEEHMREERENEIEGPICHS